MKVDLDPNDDILVDVQRLFDNTWEDVPDPEQLQRNGRRDPHTDEGNGGDDQTPARLPIPSEEDGVWRQARISLADFAGSDELRFRFDFTTAGSMTVGNPLTVGSELQAIAASRLRDGDTFTIDGIVFEFEMGLTLNVTGGNLFRDGEILVVDNGFDVPVTYEFTNGSPAPGRVAVAISADDNSRDMARRLRSAILSNGPAGVIPRLVDNRLNLENAVRVALSDNPAIIVEGNVGTFGLPVPVHLAMSSQEVAQAMVQPIADQFAKGMTDAVKAVDYFVRIVGHTIDDPGPLGMSDVLPGDEFGLFSDRFADDLDKLRGQNNTSTTVSGDPDGDDWVVPFEGPYIDDLIIGFASRGEAVRDLRPDQQTQKSCLFAETGNEPCTPTINGEDVTVGREYFVPASTVFAPTDKEHNIEIGEYQIEIRRAAEFTLGGIPIFSFDPKDRLSNSVTLFAEPGADLVDGQLFTLDDGLQSVTFEFDNRASADGVDPDNVPVPFFVSDQDFEVAQQIRQAINAPAVQIVLAIKAAAPDGTVVGPDSGQSNRINLFGNVAGEPVGIEFVLNEEVGSSNRFRDQGQVLITSNQISNSLLYGVVVEDGLRDLPTYDFFTRQQHAQFTTGDYTPHPGAARHMRDPNNNSLTSGVTIANNVIANSGQGGIHFGGNRNGFVIVAEQARDTTIVITDNNGLTEQFLFAPAGPDIVVDLMRAISATNLDVTLFRGTVDELFVEGAKSVSAEGTFAVPEGGVPLGRILNNTLVGKGGRLLDASDQGGGSEPIPDNASFQDVGILVEDNAAPTLLNNVVVNFDTAVAADRSSLDTVQGGTIFQGSNSNLRNIDVGDFSIQLTDDDSLFVDFVDGNYIPSSESRAIDSSIDSLEDRPEFVRIKAPLGIPVSSVLAPNEDVTGQLRVDDPNVEPPAGLGNNVFKDRGAIDRADFAGPTAVLLNPRDNDAEGNDQNPADTIVQLPGRTVLNQFSIQISDGLGPADPRRGTGVDRGTVSSASIVVIRENLNTGTVLTLVPDIDYTFSYDVTNSIIRLTPLAGVWETDNSYTILLDNSSDTGVLDMAGNRLKANQTTGETKFTIVFGGIQDFGDAPDPAFPTLLASTGARHTIVDGFFLGNLVDAEPDGQPTPLADGDEFDEDGVAFDSVLQVGTDTTFTVVASAPGMLDAWIDWNGDGDWDDAGEQIFTNQPLTAGSNGLNVPVPESASQGFTFARFRFSSEGGLPPTGPAPDGEVEDYRLEVRANPWQNSPDPLNVTNNPSGLISPLDALVVINELNSRTYSDPVTGALPVPPPIPPGSTEGEPFFYDVNGDGFATPLDALIVINFLNAQSALGVAASVAATADVGMARTTGDAQAVASGPVGGTLDATSGTFVSDPFVVPSQDGVSAEPSNRVAQQATVEDDVVGRPLDPTAQPQRDGDAIRVARRSGHRAEDRWEALVGEIAEEVEGAQQTGDPREQLFAGLG
ncbi:MAG: GEVED domain-containing protein [Pirellulales bacterium]